MIKRTARRIDGTIDLIDGAGGDGSQHLTGCRFDVGQGCTIRRGNSFPVDEMQDLAEAGTIHRDSRTLPWFRF